MIYIFSKKNIILLFSLAIIFIGSMLTYSIYNKSVIANISSNVIIIDPGHGGEDGGAVGVTGTKEKDLNLQIATKLKDKLLSSGFNVIMTRDKDIMLCDNNQKKNKKRTDLQNRVNITKKFENGILLSIHMNYFEDKTQKGAQIFYSRNNEKSRELADYLQKEFVDNIDINNKRKSKPAGKEIYILDNIKIPACLIECGFISNPYEEQQLKDDIYQQKVADTIANSLIKYLSQ